MNQLSELQPGLVFSASLSEWDGARDSISGISGTATDTYNVLGRGGEGRRSLSFNGTSDYVTLPTISAFGTGDFSIIIRGSGKICLGQYTQLRFYFDGVNNIVLLNGASYNVNIRELLDGNTHAVIVSRTSSVLSFKIDNYTADVIGTNGYNITDTDYSLGRAGSSYSSGSISMCRIFNYALTPTQIANYSKPSYPIEWVDRGATGANLVLNGDFTSGDSQWVKESGVTIVDQGGGNYKGVFTNVGNNVGIYQNGVTITSGHSYRVTYTVSAYSSGSSYINLGYGKLGTKRTADGTYSEILTATGSSTSCGLAAGAVGTTFKVDDISFIDLGCVLDLNAEGINRQNISTVSASYWWDATNNITATVSGASVMIPSASNLGAMSFGGTSYISGYSFTPGSADFTISLWVNKSTNDGMYFFGGGNSSFAFNTSGNSLLVTKVDVVDLTVSSSSITLNTWYMVSYTRSNGVGRYYINGALINSITDTQNYSVTSTIVGKRYNGVSYMIGLLSNISIWSRILDQDQIKLLYSLGR